MPQMKFGIWNMSMKKGTRTQSLYEIGNMGPQKLGPTEFWNMGRGKI